MPAIWTDVEPGIAILAACLPTMKPLFTRFFTVRGQARDESTQLTENSSSRYKHSGTEDHMETHGSSM